MIDSLLREHTYRAISGDVLTMGRHTIYCTPEEILLKMKGHGLAVDGLDPADIDLDVLTLNRADAGRDSLISDRGLFRLLGAKTLRALDISNYEGAEIIHDLGKPLPPELSGVADFVIDGSTLDNTFNPAQTLQNYSALLRPGGRLLMANLFTCWGTAYVIMPLLWYLDYFVMNRFVDCKAYIISVTEGVDRTAVYWLDVDFLQKRRHEMGRFMIYDSAGRAIDAPYQMATLIFAEKGEDSTTDIYPVQQDYRSDSDWEIYLDNLKRVQASKRPHLIRSTGPRLSGNLRIDENYQPVG
jgi:SAM-dependent methyltransferase